MRGVRRRTETNPYSVCSFDGISAFSTREEEPAKASRPFDRDRDGLVPAEAVPLSSLRVTNRPSKGAPILAEVLGYGFSSNGDNIAVPNVDGPARSLEMAIREAGIDKRK